MRGEVIDPARAVQVRRLANVDRETGEVPTLREQPRWWTALDVDNVPRPPDLPAADLAECARIVLPRLPAPFQKAACIVQASSSHGVKPGIRLRLWFWLDRATSGPEMKYWLRGAPVDGALFSPAQPTYTAVPIFATGSVDPMPMRMVRLPGATAVAVPPATTLAPSPRPPLVISAPSSKRGTGTHAENIVARVLRNVRTAPKGERHPTLRAAARTIGGLLTEAGISEGDAASKLLDAAKAADAEDLDLAASTIAWGLANGRAAPIRLETR